MNPKKRFIVDALRSISEFCPNVYELTATILTIVKKILFLQPISSSLPSVFLARTAQTVVKFSLKGEPESRSIDDYSRFWDTGSSLHI
ncbi:hypothetical protein YC2023_011902 [Brassica napus]